MKKILSIIAITIIAVGLFSCTGSSEERPVVKRPVVKRLNAQGDIYTKGDTLRINGKKYIKVYGITHCKYRCPVLIEVD